MPKLIVSTCGTSFLSNDVDAETGALLRATGALSEADLSGEQRRALDAHIAVRAAILEKAGVSSARNLCAELRALAMNGDLDEPGAGDHHLLVCSDTYQGLRVADALQDWLVRRRSVERLDIAGLVPRRLPDFRAALSELARRCVELIEQHRASRRGVVFNLNGGFKAVQGFMQTLGCHCADECIYVFETGEEIMRIPRLPMTLDPDGVVGRHLATIRAMAHRQVLAPAETAGIPETLLFELDGQVLLSEWGEVLWLSCRDRYYGLALQPPPTDKVAFGPRFQRDAADLARERLIQLNRQIDAVATFLAGPRQAAPRSLRFQALKGDPVEGSTHEFYAWSDGNASRCFGHFSPDGRQFVIDRLDKHL